MTRPPAALDERELRRIARQLALPGFGLPQQERLAEAHVLVIGAGGLGCPAMQSLAAVGVGRITVIDDDDVDLSNIHRQILFGADDEGRPKVEVAAERLRRLQPGITVTPLRARFTSENAVELVAAADLVLDGSDTFATKYLVADAAELTGTPLVWGTVLRYRGDVALWWSGPGSPEGGAGLRDLFPDQPAADSVPDCATAGVLGVTTAVVAGLMATEAVKHLSGIGTSLVGTLLSYDALAAETRKFSVSHDPDRSPVLELRDDYGPSVCRPPGGTGDADTGDADRREADAALALLDAGRAVALDVREAHEKLIADLRVPGLHMPLSEISPEAFRALLGRAARALNGGFDQTQSSDETHRSGEIIVYCASGKRSGSIVAEWETAAAEEFGLRLRSLPGGVNALPHEATRPAAPDE